MLDIATSRKTQDEIAFYLNTGSSGYSSKQIITQTLSYPSDICAADLNGDGFYDIASIELYGKAARIFINQNGAFPSSQKIDSNVFFAPVAIFSADFTNDSIPDLLAIDDTVVYMYENDGNANFTRHRVAGKTEFYSGNVADINGDSLPDIILGSIKLYTYINNGNGTFTRDTRNETLIHKFIFEIELADIDNDGDNDVAIYYSNTDSNIDWYQNDGSGKFTAGGNITSTANDVHSMRLADLNSDNYPDFVTGYGQTGELVWIQNNNGSFGNEIVLNTYNLFTRTIEVADADQDGDIDIFCGQHSEGLFLWENLSPHIGIEEAEIPSFYYPNPSSGIIHMNVQSESQLKVLSINGQILRTYSLTSGKNTLRLNLSKGTYILILQDKNQVHSEKLILR